MKEIEMETKSAESMVSGGWVRQSLGGKHHEILEK